MKKIFILLLIVSFIMVGCSANKESKKINQNNVTENKEINTAQDEQAPIPSDKEDKTNKENTTIQQNNKEEVKKDDSKKIQENKKNNNSNTSNTQASQKKNDNDTKKTETPKKENPKKEETPKNEENQTPPKKEEQEKPHQHMFSINGGWYKTEAEAVARFDQELKKWDSKLEKKEITWEEYGKKCPSGYEIYRCTCGMQGLNYSYEN